MFKSNLFAYLQFRWFIQQHFQFHLSISSYIQLQFCNIMHLIIIRFEYWWWHMNRKMKKKTEKKKNSPCYPETQKLRKTVISCSIIELKQKVIPFWCIIYKWQKISKTENILLGRFFSISQKELLLCFSLYTEYNLRDLKVMLDFYFVVVFWINAILWYLYTMHDMSLVTI